MGWFTTEKNETLRGKAARTASRKRGELRDNRMDKRQSKGRAVCIQCNKPIRGASARKANLHPGNCARQFAKSL